MTNKYRVCVTVRVSKDYMATVEASSYEEAEELAIKAYKLDELDAVNEEPEEPYVDWSEKV